MKLLFGVLIATTLTVYEGARPRTAYAQIGSPICVQCGGSPQQPVCCGGFESGSLVCWVEGYSCVAQDPCNTAGPGGCFAAGTLVDTPDGVAAIEELQVGDRVLGRSSDGQSVVNVVIETYRTLAVEYLIINDEISVTGTHPFLVGNNWVEAKDVRVNDILMGSDGTAVLVSSVRPIEHGVRVFNLAVSGNHTFFAGGFLVHNKGPNPEG